MSEVPDTYEEDMNDRLKAKYKSQSLTRFEDKGREWDALDKSNLADLNKWVSDLLSEWYKTDQNRIDAKMDGAFAQKKAKALEDHLAIAEAGIVPEEQPSLLQRFKSLFTDRSR